MKRPLLTGFFLLWAGNAAGQDVASTPSGVLRWLDKVSGLTNDIEIKTGETRAFGRLEVTMGECRYPVEDPTSNAYAYLFVTDPAAGTTAFEGWMIASSPALSALDDPRYDIWVLRCNNS